MLLEKLDQYISFNDINESSEYTFRDLKKWLGLCQRAISKRLRLPKSDVKKSSHGYPKGNISNSRFQTVCILWVIYQLLKHHEAVVTKDTIYTIIEFAYILSKPSDNAILRTLRCPEISRERSDGLCDTLLTANLVSVSDSEYSLTDNGKGLIEIIIEEFGWVE